jgi:7,8-dihydroneopterin aldolase/epimerase/oxygenase
MPKALMDRVTLKGMRFHTHIGVLPHEAEIAQSIEVDVSVWVSGRTGGAAGVVDYRELYDIAATVLGGGHIKYLEDVGQRICDRALKLSGVSRVCVVVRKPHVALGGPLDYAEVEVERSQD